MKQNRVTLRQAIKLAELGYNEETCAYIPKMSKEDEFNMKWLTQSSPCDWNNTLQPLYLSVPTIDEAIDWIRRKFDVVIYNSFCPHKGAIPKIYTNRGKTKIKVQIFYGYSMSILKPSMNIYIEMPTRRCSYNIYTAKRMILNDAITWINKNYKK